jgi:hypothetical protein
MKNILLTLSLLGMAFFGAATASAQYYGGYYDYGMMPAATTYTTSGYYSYGAGVGSYTIGCTTYYYNTATGANLGSQNICQYQTPGYAASPSYYTNPSYTTYDYYNTNTYNSYTNPSTQYCTWGYRNGSWRPCTGGSILFGNNYNYNNTYQNYLNCYYDPYGQYICW